MPVVMHGLYATRPVKQQQETWWPKKIFETKTKKFRKFGSILVKFIRLSSGFVAKLYSLHMQRRDYNFSPTVWAQNKDNFCWSGMKAPAAPALPSQIISYSSLNSDIRIYICGIILLLGLNAIIDTNIITSTRIILNLWTFWAG